MRTCAPRAASHGVLRPRRVIGALCTLIVFPTACTDGRAPDDVRVVTRDSAGVEIAEIQGDPWDAPVWGRLDTTGVLRIEPDDARPETLFGSIQDALRL